MKKLVAAAISLVILTSAAHADDAKLKMKITGPVNNNRYFLCVSTVGCVSIFAGNKGKIYPLDPGAVTNIYTVDAANMSMHMQKAAMGNCHDINVQDNQTLTVSGKLTPEANGAVGISNMHCTVSG